MFFNLISLISQLRKYQLSIGCDLFSYFPPELYNSFRKKNTEGKTIAKPSLYNSGNQQIKVQL